jgi:hypothetical protein
MTIGNEATAKMLHTYFNGDASSGTRRSPRGYRRIGEGAYRSAILERATDTVYKIGDSWANETEVQTASRLIRKRKAPKRLGFELVIPETQGFRVGKDSYGEDVTMVAQQFAKDAKGTWCSATGKILWDSPWGKPCDCKGRNYGLCFGQALKRIKEWTGLGDIHALNVLVDKSGRFWLIDMGDDCCS